MIGQFEKSQRNDSGRDPSFEKKYTGLVYQANCCRRLQFGEHSQELVEQGK